jgi:hypothetical protein
MHASEAVKSLEHPPEYIFLRDKDCNRVGVVFIYYDNVVCVIYNAACATDYEHSLKANAAAANAQWKEFVVTKPANMDCRTGGAFFLGVHMATSVSKAVRQDAFHTTIVWRHPTSKLADHPAVTAELVDPQCTRRQLARAVGLIIWNTYLSNEPLCSEASAIHALSLNCKTDAGWDEPTTVPSADRDILGQALGKILLNPWREAKLVPADAQHVYVATDACETGAGYVELNPDTDSAIDIQPIVWPLELENAHIFLKELFATVAAIERVMSKHPLAQKVTVVCDNTAACHALERRFSSNSHALELICRLEKKLSARQAQLTVVSIRGVDNVADCISRGHNRALDDRRLSTCLQIREHTQGRSKLYSIEPYEANDMPEIRHDEELD